MTEEVKLKKEVQNGQKRRMWWDTESGQERRPETKRRKPPEERWWEKKNCEWGVVMTYRDIEETFIGLIILISICIYTIIFLYACMEHYYITVPLAVLLLIIKRISTMREQMENSYWREVEDFGTIRWAVRNNFSTSKAKEEVSHK